MYDLRTNRVRRIKVETDKMISSMVVHNNLLITSSGSCRGKNGVLQFISMNNIKYNKELEWIMCCNIDSDGSFLDISAHNGILFTTTSQNEKGYSTVSRVYLDSRQIVPCDLVKGHGWRICNHDENYIVAGQHETRFYDKQRVC